MIAYIGIGSNLSNRERNIEKAISILKEKCNISKSSSIYETEPVGFKDQDWFLNCVVEVDTNLKPLELLDFLQSIEKKLKRVKTIKNGPRTIDLDILFFSNEIINNERLIVPHPRLHERLFVLEPFNEINPEFMHPILKRSIKDLTYDLKKEILGYEIKKLAPEK
jgi:2-amino-4-hydroxy-6-hydroxymethyldihydropteridine diphosphokinase